ncbi:MAG: hypothetical protein JNM24_16190 [Bdellovibrionaceae bacterium]|nr:hypothetical protein [Pseudobdellovibrionaceae bacterium]
MKVFAFLIVLFLFVPKVYSQDTSSDCPSKLGWQAYGDSTYREYFCGEEDRGYSCDIVGETSTTHRDNINPAYLGECTTEYCTAKSYVFYLYPTGYSPQFFSWCNVYVSAGNGDSNTVSSESKNACTHSHVIVDTLSFEEQIPVQGVPFYLNYSSDRYKIGYSTLPTVLGLGGWTPNILHDYDLIKKILFYGYGGQTPTEKNPLLSNSGAFFIPSDSGNEVFYFDGWGRHTKTVDSVSGVTIYKFVYDSATKKLTKVIDRYAKETIFDYTTNQLTITSPRGEVTTLNLDTNGMLASLVNRNSETYQMTYTSQKQLTTFQKPGGQTSTVTYHSDGSVLKDLGAGGDFLNFARAVGATINNQNTTMTTARGVANNLTTVATSTQVDRAESLSFGEVVYSTSIKGGLYSSTSSVGPQFSATRVSDPRYPADALYYEQDIRYQGGSPIDIRNFITKTVDASSPTNPHLFSTLTTTYKLQNDSNRIFTSVYTASNKKLVVTSPLAKTSEVSLNTEGVPSEYKIGSLYPISFTYNSFGDLTYITQNDRTSEISYDTYGNISTYTDALGRVTNYTYDNSNRLTQYTLHNGAVGNFGYDANGNVTTVKPPGKTNHSFVYGLLELATSYLPPSISSVVLGQETYEYNLDNQMTKVNRASGVSIDLTYHSTTGLLTQMSAPSGNIDFVYYSNSDLIRYRNQTSGLNLEYGYIGKILNSIKTSGTLANEVSFTYNADASVASIQVIGSDNVSSSAAYTYSRDGLMVEAGSADYTRNHFNAIATITNNQVQTTNTFNNFGELSTAVTKYQTQTLADYTYTRDKLSRVTTVAENLRKVNGTYETATKTYGYDTVGRLETVTSGGVTTTYEYDHNGNRTKKITPSATKIGTYDEQDRLVQYGNLYYAYNSNGERTLKTEKIDSNPANDLVTQYFYNSYGLLTKVILPDTKVIEYLIDGQGRRVGRKVNGTLVEGYIYQSQTQIAAVTNGSGVVTKRFIYGEKINMPDLMITGGQEYRVVSDHLGTPRQVINLTTGAVDSKLNVDEFGNFLSIEGTERLPFRFAGGLWDADSKLLRFGARDYDPTIGRWISKDPILFRGGDTNLYGYVMNDPINFIDPRGLSQEQIDNALTWIGANYPSLVSGISPKGYDLPLIPSWGGWTIPGSERFIIDTRGGSDAWVLGRVVHELLHIKKGFLFTIFDQTDNYHDMMDIYADQVMEDYMNRKEKGSRIGSGNSCPKR